MLKTFKSIMYIAAAAMAFTACNVEPVEAPEETVGTHKVSFVASQLDTKTTMDINNGIASFDWEEADVDFFHIFENEYSNKATYYDADIDENGAMQLMATFNNGGTAPFTYFGFYAPTFFNYPSVPFEQTDNGKYDPKADILIAKPVTAEASQSDEILSFQFKRIVAINVMTLKGLTAGETVSEVKIVSDKPIAGKYDHTKDEWYNSTDLQITVSANSVVNDKGEAVIYFVSAPVEEAQLTITATTAAGKTYSKELAKTISFTEGGVKTFGVTVSVSEDVPQTPVELFYESFDNCTSPGGNDDNFATAGNDKVDGLDQSSFLDNSGWSFTNAYKALSCMKFGGGSAKGTATTPSISCNGDVILSFKAAAWNGSKEAKTLNISASNGIVSESSVTLVKAEWKEYTISISGVETSTKITFEAAITSNNRFFLDEVKIVTAAPDTRTVLATPANLAVTDKVITWDAVENAGSYLVTIGENDPVEVNTNSYDATAIADEYYDVAVVAVPTDTDTYKKSAPATLEGAKFGNPVLATPTLSAGAIDESSITVTWTNDPRATEGYEAIIYKDMGDGTLRNLTTEDHDQIGIKTGSATFTELEESQAYEIRVMAMPVTEPRAYHFSSNGTIKLATRAAQHVSDVTEAGNYTIKGLTVYASNGSNQSVLGDGTGYILDYGSKKTVGEIYNVSGNVVSYRGIWEFSNATGTKTGETQGDVTYPTPIEFTASEATSYISSPYINYVHFSGKVDASTGYITVGNVDVTVYNTSKGKTYDVLGFTIGYKEDSYISVMPVSLTDVTPTLSVSSTSKTWKFNETDEVTFNVSSTNGSWTVSPTTLEWATVAVDASAGTITVTPNGQNTSEADYEATLTVIHTFDATLTKTITLKQEMESEGGQGSATKTYQHVFTTKPDLGENSSLSNVNWNITATNLGSYNSANYAGVQIGAKSASGEIKLTSSSAWSYDGATKVKEVRIWLNTGGTNNVTPTVTIGGVSATSDGTAVVKNSTAGRDWTQATKVTFVPDSTDTGVVVIDVTTVAPAGYICAIEIDCE